MRRRGWMCLALAAVTALSGMPAQVNLAEEVVLVEEEVLPDEEVEIADDAGAAVEVQDQTDAPADAQQEADEGADEAGLDLIEDDGIEVVTVSEGGNYEEIQTAESEADAAAQKVRELMDGIPVQLESADRERISAYLEGLTVTESPIGSDGELEIGAYIEETMRSFGYTISEQHFHEGFLNSDYVDVPGVNIIAERGADSDERTREIILICGHYDAKTDPKEDDPLANDKGSAAALLECARILSGVDTNVDLCFLFLSGEEDGYYGSLRLAEGLTEEIVGRIKCVLYVGPVGYVMKEEEPEAAAQEETPGAEEAASDPASETESEAEEGRDKGEPLPLLISVPSGESNDPADLMRALGLYRKAEEMLAGDILYAAGTDAGAGADGSADGGAVNPGNEMERPAVYTPQEWASYAAGRQEWLAAHPFGSLPPAPGEAPDAAWTSAVKEENAKQALENMKMLAGLEDWTLVKGTFTSLLRFTDRGMTAAGLFQPVDERMASFDCLMPLEGEGQTQSAAEPDGSVSSSVGAEQVSDILLAAGSDASQEETQTAQPPRVIPVLDADELARTADDLASIVSLYMRSQTSIQL